MSTTSIYGAIFIIPKIMTNTPLGFTILHKGYDGLNNDLGYYTYNEYMALPGNKAFYTPSDTHALLSENITSIYIRDDINAQLVGTPFVLVDGKDTDRWHDLDQTYYIWCVTTDKRMAYNYEVFSSESPLYNKGTTL